MLQDYEQALVWIERAEAAAPEISPHGIGAFCAACPRRSKRTRRAQQCSAIWRTTKLPSGPCLNGVLDGPAPHCSPGVRAILFGGKILETAFRKLGCRSKKGRFPKVDELIAPRLSACLLWGQSLRFDGRPAASDVTSTPDMSLHCVNRREVPTGDNALGPLAPICQVGQCPLTAMAQAEYPTPSHIGCR